MTADGSAAGPQEMRQAKVFDGFKADGTPLVRREGLGTVDEVMRIVGYLKASPAILFARSLDVDYWADPDAPPAVPKTYSTDGTWIWAGSVTYYLQKYGMPPDPELLAHIRAQSYTAPEVSEEAMDAAARQLTGGGVGARPTA